MLLVKRGGVARALESRDTARDSTTFSCDFTLQGQIAATKAVPCLR